MIPRRVHCSLRGWNTPSFLKLEAQNMGDQLQQVVSRPDHGAVIVHPSTLADIERKRTVAVALSQKRSIPVKNSGLGR